MPRKVQAHQREVAGGPDPAGVELAGDQRPDAEGERDRPEHVARVEHRRMDRHVGVAQQRRQPGALGRSRVEVGERLGLEDHQPDEEGAEAGEDRRRPGHDLAVAAAGDEEDPARGQREHPGPEQQRALLARPHRGQLVEGRRGRRGVIGDQREVEVVAEERDLDEDDRRGEQPGHRVDRARGRSRPSGGRRCGRRRRRRPPRRARRAGRRPAVRSRGSSAGLPRRRGRELRRALRDQAVPLADEGAVLELAGDDHLAPVAERIRHRARCR